MKRIESGEIGVPVIFKSIGRDQFGPPIGGLSREFEWDVVVREHGARFRFGALDDAGRSYAREYVSRPSRYGRKWRSLAILSRAW